MDCLVTPARSDSKQADAGRLRDFLIAKKLTTRSIKQIFATVHAAVNLTISEHGTDCADPFSRACIPEVGTKTIRPPAPIDVIRSVQRT